MAGQDILKHYTRLLRLWPTDRLRPANRHFQTLLQSRLSSAPAITRDENKEINAAYLLLENAFIERHRLTSKTLQPTSNPAYYADLEREMAAVPDRSWVTNLGNKLTGWIRWK